MKKFLIISTMLAMTVLTGCATTSKSATNQQSVAKMQVTPIKLNFKQKHHNPVFYDESTLQKLLTACIQDELSKAGKLSTESTSPTLAVNLDYKRSYLGEVFGMKNSIGDVRFGFDYQISQNGQVLQQGAVKDKIVPDPAGFDKNTIAESENKFINAVCRSITKTIH